MTEYYAAWQSGVHFRVPRGNVFLELVERGTTQWDADRAELLRMRVRWHNGEPNEETTGGPVTS